MNRIYQGRVSSVQIPNPSVKNEWDPLPNWQDTLWQHHELFQDAVNYYVVCLLALAQPGNPVFPIREKLDAKTPEGNDDDLMVWRSFRRRGAMRRGLRDSVVPYICAGKAEASPEECFAAVLAGNIDAQSEAGHKRLDAGLRQLLDKCTGAAGCKNAAPEFLPRYCKPAFTGNYGEDITSVARKTQGARFPFVLHDASTRADSAALDEFGVHSIALPNEKKPRFTGKDVAKKLHDMVREWRKRQPEVETDWARLDTAIEKLPEGTELPGYAATSAKNEVKFRLFAMFLFRYVERSEFTLNLLKATTRKPDSAAMLPESKTAEPGVGDPIRLARGERGYVFRAFTSLSCWGGDVVGTPQWIAFDFAAFEEALKALHQVDAKAEERRKTREQKKAQHDFQRGRTKKWKGGATGEDERRPDILAGDPRIARLEQLVDDELRDEYEMSEGVAVKYGLQQRTIRGFREVRKKWNDALKPDSSFSNDAREKLWSLLIDYKKDNAQTMGSPAIFDAMVEERNWIIWREPTADQMRQWREAEKLPDDAEFAKDPLQALTDERELLEEIERLKGPIRFTPADPEHSRRQFYFSDVSALDKKNRLRHDRQTIEVEIALKATGNWEPKWVTIRFTAPRLLRDQLNTSESGPSAAFQQAMMTALGLKAGLKKTEKGKQRDASFAECAAVALMPEVTSSGEKRILLNFPIKLDAVEIPKQFLHIKGREKLFKTKKDPQTKQTLFDSYWEKQMVASYSKRKLDAMFHLRWPTSWHKEKKELEGPPPSPWWKEVASFSCLAVDLGQRDAGAFALLEATPGNAPKSQSRKLGAAGDRTWWATVRATGMLRLPGEDALVMRQGQWEEEFSGERGRLASEPEWNDARDICTKLGLLPDTILGTDRHRYSFPELNDQLLFALRKAQGRLARLQSWSGIESNEKRKEAIAKQLREAIIELSITKSGMPPDTLLVELKPLIEKEAWASVASRLIQEVESVRITIPRELERIADRIQPLRGRRWQWTLRMDKQNHFLCQTAQGSNERKKLLAGQRGLSLERVEQLESLRQRCQSLNRALRQTPGQPANLGRSKRGIELPDPCPELLDRLDALKEQRVNQTAHLILAQALGVRLCAHTKDAAMRAAQDIHGEYERIPGREPVDFLVLENLDRYLATQGRSRAENSRLMKWCHRAILGKLKQLCEPYGLRVLETPAAYSSRFCSLTGTAGFRAVEVTPTSAKEFRWKKHLDRLIDPEREKKLGREEREESLRVKQLFDTLEKMNADIRKANPARPKWRTLLAPRAGGPIFIPASETERYDRKNPQTGKMERVIGFKEINGRRPVVAQADINAAINLGLRAIASPEAGDIHLRIRAKREGAAFVVRAENLREKAHWGEKLPQISVPKDSDLKKLLTETHLNFFADLGGVAEYDLASIENNTGFASGRGIWGTINGNDWHLGKDWKRVEELNRARLQKWERDNDDIPMR